MSSSCWQLARWTARAFFRAFLETFLAVGRASCRQGGVLYPEQGKKLPSSFQFRTGAEPHQRGRAGRFVPAGGDGEAAENRLGLELLAGTPSVFAPAQHFFAPCATSARDFVTADVDPRRGAGFLQEKHPGRRGRAGAVLWAGSCARRNYFGFARSSWSSVDLIHVQ